MVYWQVGWDYSLCKVVKPNKRNNSLLCLT